MNPLKIIGYKPKFLYFYYSFLCTALQCDIIQII